MIICFFCLILWGTSACAEHPDPFEIDGIDIENDSSTSVQVLSDASVDLETDTDVGTLDTDTDTDTDTDSDTDTDTDSDTDTDTDSDTDTDTDSDTDTDTDTDSDTDSDPAVSDTDTDSESNTTDTVLRDSDSGQEVETELESMVELLVLQERDSGVCSRYNQVESEHDGYTGKGYLSSRSELGVEFIWRIWVQEAGDYQLGFRYAVGEEEDRLVSMQINQKTVETNIFFRDTGDWENWEIEVFDVELVKGDNTIGLTALQPLGLPNVDYLQILGVPSADVTPSQCSIFGF